MDGYCSQVDLEDLPSCHHHFSLYSSRPIRALMATAMFTRSKGDPFHYLEEHMNNKMLFPLVVALLVGLFGSPQHCFAAVFSNSR
jgi:hypothetical protein